MGSTGAGADSTAGAVPVAGPSPAIGTGSGDSIRRGVGSASGVEGVEMAFEFSEDINDEDRRTSIVSPISSSSKSSSMNLSSSIVGSSKTSIVIIISFKESFRSFRSKNSSLLKIIFFFNRTSRSYEN